MLQVTLHFGRETKNKVRYSCDSGEVISDVYVDKSAFSKGIQAKKNWPDEIRLEVSWEDLE